MNIYLQKVLVNETSVIGMLSKHSDAGFVIISALKLVILILIF